MRQVLTRGDLAISLRRAAWKRARKRYKEHIKISAVTIKQEGMISDEPKKSVFLVEDKTNEILFCLIYDCE